VASSRWWPYLDEKNHINIFEVAVENCVKNADFNAKD
jgi:hypothetical protein